MSLSKRLLSLSFRGLFVLVAPLLVACTLTPVYSENSAAKANLQLAYAQPVNRLEQIVYQDLAFRLGGSDSETAVLASVSVVSSIRAVAASTTVNPNKPYDVTLTGTLTLTVRDGSNAEPITLIRRATASYTQNGQVGADASAEIGATEQAAHALAESLRLAVLATMSR
ncbi:hypothetical protein [Devosia sp.]|uniref:hypothetical protein n=1 Tax=Devosia sp. TaxID=1871048 RepID=UPI003266FC45